MTISERDKKLLLILLFVAVLILPYFLLTQRVMEKNASLEEQNGTLKSRKSELEGYALNQDTYISESEQMLSKAQKLLSRFPSDYTQEAELVFLNNVERNIAIELYQTSFGENPASALSGSGETAAEEETSEEAGEETAATNSVSELLEVGATTQFSYDATYDGFKTFLNYIKEHHDRMVIGNITASYGTGLVSGSFTLTQYVLQGGGRKNFSFTAPEYSQGSGNIFIPATGIYESVEDDENYIADFVAMLTRPDLGEETFLVGRNGTADGDSYLSSDENARKEITITFTGSDGEYDAVYSIDDENNEDSPVSFYADGVIYFDVISSARSGDDDEVEATISVINATDVRVIVHVKNDPEPPDTRVRFSGNTGNVEVKD